MQIIPRKSNRRFNTTLTRTAKSQTQIINANYSNSVGMTPANTNAQIQSIAEFEPQIITSFSPQKISMNQIMGSIVEIPRKGENHRTSSMPAMAIIESQNTLSTLPTNKRPLRPTMSNLYFSKILDKMHNRKKTVTRFCFKMCERDEDPFLKPIIQKISEERQGLGTMNVNELWSDGVARKYLQYSNMNDGKYMLRQLAKMASKRGNQSGIVPQKFTNRDENHLRAMVQSMGYNAFKRQYAENHMDHQSNWMGFKQLQQTSDHKSGRKSVLDETIIQKFYSQNVQTEDAEQSNNARVLNKSGFNTPDLLEKSRKSKKGSGYKPFKTNIDKYNYLLEDSFNSSKTVHMYGSSNSTLSQSNFKSSAARQSIKNLYSQQENDQNKEERRINRMKKVMKQNFFSNLFAQNSSSVKISLPVKNQLNQLQQMLEQIEEIKDDNHDTNKKLSQTLSAFENKLLEKQKHSRSTISTELI